MKKIQLIVEAGVNIEQENKIASIARVKYVLPSIGLYVVEIPEARVDELREIEGVNSILSDTHIMAQNIFAIKSFKKKLTGMGVTVAILDTGIAPVNDLVNPKTRIIDFVDFVNNKGHAYDDNAHGTHVAGIIAGNGRSSYGEHVGLAPEANIIGVKVLDEHGRGKAADALAGIQWVLDNQKKYNIRVVNLSIGTEDLGSMDPLVRSVETLWDAGVVVVIAAGNNGPNYFSITSPGISRKVITVGASDDNIKTHIWGSQKINFSGRGPTSECIIKPDILAPGTDIISTLSTSRELGRERKKQLNIINGNYVKMSGTSMACPFVTGAVALFLQNFPNSEPNDVKLALKRSAVDLNYPKNRQGWGLIDVNKFVTQEPKNILKSATLY